MQDLSQHAISLALRGNWSEALQINLKVISDNSLDVDALNRISKCYEELGQFQKAKIFAKKVLEIDPFNNIAKKSLKKLQLLKNGSVLPTTTLLSANIFLEEPGKTKLVPLVKLTDPRALLCLNCGSEVIMEIKMHKINIVTTIGTYIGKLPDDISSRLIKLIDNGNTYKAYIKTASPKEVKLFIKEIKRSKSISHIPSFSAEKLQYVAFTAPELVHNKKPVSSA